MKLISFIYRAYKNYALSYLQYEEMSSRFHLWKIGKHSKREHWVWNLNIEHFNIDCEHFDVDERLSDKVRYNWIRHILIIMLDVSSTSCYWWLTILSANAVNQNYFIIPLYIKCIPYLNNITIDWHIFIGYLPLPVDKTDKYMLFYLYLELFNKLSMVQSQLFHMGL